MKSITKDDLNKLKETLDTIETKSAILNDKTFRINDVHMNDIYLEVNNSSLK